MSDSMQSLAREKERLLARSAACRMELRRQSLALREALQWRKLAMSAATTPSLQRVAFGAALSIVGLRRSARLLALAGRVVLLAKLARGAIATVAGVGGR
jgi:hypothetical protein